LAINNQSDANIITILQKNGKKIGFLKKLDNDTQKIAGSSSFRHHFSKNRLFALHGHIEM
jgi:lipopolysaccharide export system protein LptA